MKIEDAMQAAHGVATELGRVMLEIGKISPEARELFEQDLDNPEMGLDKLAAALESYARKNKKGSSWGCAVFEIDAENPVVKVILDFYHIPAEWLPGGRKTPLSQAVGRGQSGNGFDLMDLL